jgi:hypothetical protein
MSAQSPRLSIAETRQPIKDDNQIRNDFFVRRSCGTGCCVFPELFSRTCIRRRIRGAGPMIVAASAPFLTCELAIPAALQKDIFVRVVRHSEPAKDLQAWC